MGRDVVRALRIVAPGVRPNRDAPYGMLSRLRLLRKRDLYTIILLLCALLAFAPGLRAYFLADDYVLLSWTRAQTPGGVLGFFDPHTTWFYRPLVKLFYWSFQGSFGLHPLPYHIFSLAMHGLNCALLYRLVRRHSDTLGRVAGITAGLLFALNPHSAESVSWIASAGDLGATASILGSLL
ncbi:MAG: hypothetical protein M3014_12055, partial [Chloroflexota bacterium]|nr:hypothetical protein [Chloroflexota bacterium]